MLRLHPPSLLDLPGMHPAPAQFAAYCWLVLRLDWEREAAQTHAAMRALARASRPDLAEETVVDPSP